MLEKTIAVVEWVLRVVDCVFWIREEELEQVEVKSGDGGPDVGYAEVLASESARM